MRPKFGQWAVPGVVALIGLILAACSGIDSPAPTNGPDQQSFSTNNSLLRIVNGSPTAGSPCVVAGQATTCVDIVVDGKLVAANVPYPAVPAAQTQFAVLPYISIPSGAVLIQIYQSGTTNLVFENPPPPLPQLGKLTAGKKYSFVLAGNAPVAPDPFFNGFLFTDGLFNSQPGQVMADFHNASPNAGSQQFEVTCAACTSGGQTIGNPAGPGTIVGPVSLIPSGNYTLGTTTKQITAQSINGANVNNVLPDPTAPTKPNVSIYLIDTVGGAGNFQVIGVEDQNG